MYSGMLIVAFTFSRSTSNIWYIYGAGVFLFLSKIIIISELRSVISYFEKTNREIVVVDVHPSPL